MHNNDFNQERGTPKASRREFLRRVGLTGLGLGAVCAFPMEAAHAGIFSSLVQAPSIDQQKQVGRQAATQILQQYKEVHDGRATAFAAMGQRLVSALSPFDQQHFDYNFHVIQSDQVNAFALPGGPMFMYTGLYDKLESMDALAAVTGHEMTHVRMQHWAKAYAKQQERALGIDAFLIITHAGQFEQSAAGLLQNALSLKFSRGEETQADHGGFDNMIAAGYNPQGMIQLFDELEKLAGNGASFGGDLLSNHPSTPKRINAVQQWMSKEGNRAYPGLIPIVRS